MLFLLQPRSCVVGLAWLQLRRSITSYCAASPSRYAIAVYAAISAEFENLVEKPAGTLTLSRPSLMALTREPAPLDSIGPSCRLTVKMVPPPSAVVVQLCSVC